MKIVESGTFGEKYAYVKLKTSELVDKTLVIFPPTQELNFPIHINPHLQIKRYKSLIPRDSVGSVYIMGYDPKIDTETFLYDVAEDFAGFIKEKIGSCIIAGISYGGGVAIPFASKYPELTRKLMLIVSSYALSEHGLGICKEIIALTKNNKRREAQLRLSCLVRNPLLRIYIKLSMQLKWPRMKQYMNPPSTIVNAYTHIINHNFGLKQFIHNIKAPTLIVGATEDQFVSVELYQELADAIENCNLVLFKKATHAVPVEKLFKIKRLIKEFLKN